LLGGGERVEFDASVGVGEVEFLEGGEDVGAGGFGEPVFGEEREALVGLLGVGRERFAQLCFEQAEDQPCDPDDRDERLDAVVVVEEDRSNFECLFEIAVAAFEPTPPDRSITTIDDYLGDHKKDRNPSNHRDSGLSEASYWRELRFSRCPSRAA
jgi:hypothetical protein